MNLLWAALTVWAWACFLVGAYVLIRWELRAAIRLFRWGKRQWG